MLIRTLIPKKIRNLRHWWLARQAAREFGHPSHEMLVIGVTGTSGKSTTVFFLRQLLEQAGYRVGSLSTIDFYIAGEDKLNDQKMTMLGRSATQRYLREMVAKKCDVAIVETTSEGQLQYRNHYIAYDMMILTNLYPEHIEAHGGYENYKEAKLNIFRRASKYGFGKGLLGDGYKTGKFGALHKDCCSEFEKVFIVNGDITEAEEFLSAPVLPHKAIVFGQNLNGVTRSLPAENKLILSQVKSSKVGVSGVINEQSIAAPLYGEHNVMNITAAVAACRALGIDWSVLESAIRTLHNAPGRNEFIPEAETHGFKVIVDYAFEPKAMNALYEVVELLKPNRVIHVFGSTGGGRDVSRRFSVGELVGQRADVCIVTDEDPYDDNPRAIMEDVASAVRKTGKQDGRDLLIVPDRREAIATALKLAQVGDLVLVTGKGSEQAIVVAGGQKLPWDDRQVVREELTKL